MFNIFTIADDLCIDNFSSCSSTYIISAGINAKLATAFAKLFSQSDRPVNDLFNARRRKSQFLIERL